MNALKKLLPFLKKYYEKYFFGILFLVLVDIAQLFIPDIIRYLTDEYQAGLLDSKRILFFVVIILGTWGFIAIGRFFWRYFIMNAARTLEYDIRQAFFKKLLELSPNFFTTHKTGKLMALATNDISAVRMSVGPGVVMFVDATFMLIAVVIKMLFNTGFVLTGLVLSIMPAMLFYATHFGKLIHTNFKKSQEAFSRLTDITQESFSGITVVKGFAQEKLFGDKFGEINKKNYLLNMKLAKLQATFHPTMVFISSISFLLVLFFGGTAVINGDISLGNFIAFNMYLQMMLWPMRAFGFVINQLQRGAASFERINTVLEATPEIIDPIPEENFKDQISEIEFKTVSFSYSDVPVLKNISFKFSKYKSLAIVGNTGSGKSTIINLLLRLYDLQNDSDGEILVDGVPIKKASIKKLRESVGVVPQDNFLFSRTIYENIAFSKDISSELEDPSFDQIKKAATLADLDKNIVEFSNGYNTVVGERGVTLSGGQKQRASIARAIIKKPSLLILDDSFSAVDTETEEQIITNLREFNKDCGVLIISHRISSIKNCDEILVLSDGEIVERGNDSQLMQKQGLYYNMAMTQRLKEEEQ